MSAGSLAGLVQRAPVLAALAADFRKGTWTFALPNVPVGPGDYIVVRAGEALDALAADQEKPRGVALQAAEPTAPRYFTAGGGQAMETSTATLYRDHTPDAGREKYWKGPDCWSGSEKRLDGDGREWSRHISRMICNDHGDLVEVAR